MERNGSTTCLPTDVEELLMAVARLPEHVRLVVVLHYLDGRPVAEVAATLGRRRFPPGLDQAVSQ